MNSITSDKGDICEKGVRLVSCKLKILKYKRLSYNGNMGACQVLAGSSILPRRTMKYNLPTGIILSITTHALMRFNQRIKHAKVEEIYEVFANSIKANKKIRKKYKLLRKDNHLDVFWINEKEKVVFVTQATGYRQYVLITVFNIEPGLLGGDLPVASIRLQNEL